MHRWVYSIRGLWDHLYKMEFHFWIFNPFQTFHSSQSISNKYSLGIYQPNSNSYLYFFQVAIYATLNKIVVYFETLLVHTHSPPPPLPRTLPDFSFPDRSNVRSLRVYNAVRDQ